MGIPKEIARAEFGLDYQDQKVTSDNPVVRRIRAIPPDIDVMKRASRIESILEGMATLSDTWCEAIFEEMKSHFGLSAQSVTSMRADLKKLRKKSGNGSVPIGVTLSQEDLITKLKDQTDSRYISPAQDFHDGVMYFTTFVDGEPYLLTSDRRLIPFDAAESEGLRLVNTDVDTAKFSPDAVVSFLEGTDQLDASDLYIGVRDYIRRYIVLPGDYYDSLLALWVIGTYMFKVFAYYPYLWLNAEKRSGKSLLMTVMSKIAFNAEVFINPTQAVIFRDIAHNSITLMMDEVEHLRRQDKETHGAIMSLLNSGFERGSFVKRAEKNGNGGFALKKYPAYSPKMFAGINDINDVLRDRTIRIPLLRKKANETVDRFRQNTSNLNFHREIRDGCYLFALQHSAQLAWQYNSNEDEIPGVCHLSDRERDIWEPIFVIAGFFDGIIGSTELVDGLVSLSKDTAQRKQANSESENNTERLLTVVKTMLDDLQFHEERGHVLVYTTESVWNYFLATDEFEWLRERSKALLTRMLKDIRVDVSQKKVDGRTCRTYHIDLLTFTDMYERYCK